MCSSLPPGAPNGLRWIPDLLTPSEASACFAALLAEVPWEDHTFTIFGRTVPMPRRICMFGSHGYRYSGVCHPPRPLTPTLVGLLQRIEVRTGLAFNSVLCNLYRGGGDSMGWHTDDDYPHGGQPVIASLSLGATRMFRLRPRRAAGPRRSVGLPLSSGSLLCMDGAARVDWQHAVPRTRKPVGARINLTFRHMTGGGQGRVLRCVTEAGGSESGR